MKKLLSITLCVLMIFELAACGSNNVQQNDTSSAPEGVAQETSTPAESEEPSDTTDTAENPDQSSGGKTLVVYYSATGNTKAVAETIAEAADADTFELIPTEVYSNEDLNWTNSDSRVSREHEDESLRDVPLTETTVENWDEYDTVLIGYPIWWGIAAWPVDNFIKANDFTGKTVIPFCTAASSGIGRSGELLEEMAGTGDWQEGIRFRENPSEDDVVSWVEGLGL